MSAALIALMLPSTSASGADSVRASVPTITSLSVTSGPTSGGVRLTLKGTNLAHVSAVTFGAVHGSAVRVSATHRSLTVTAPPHPPGAVDVRVKTTAGSSHVGSHDVFTYRLYATVSANGAESCAVSSGRVHCWGLNDNGQLGDGSTTSSSTPVSVHGLTHVVAISTGRFHACALITDGTVRCWGDNFVGQLGDGTATESHVPVKVSGLSHVVVVSAGFLHTCAVLADGSARCWGDDSTGELGDNHSGTLSKLPIAVHGLKNAIGIVTGYDYSCALRGNGAVLCWGFNNVGQLGDGTLTNAHVPVLTQGLGRATQVVTGYDHACAVVAGGAVRCWGNNANGQLGDGTLINNSRATPVAGLTRVTSLGAGDSHSCALVNSQVFCWGDNEFGQVGNGNSAPDEVTASAVAKLGATIELSAGPTHNCVRTMVGTLLCWGDNEHGDLGDGTTTNRPLPVPVMG